MKSFKRILLRRVRNYRGFPSINYSVCCEGRLALVSSFILTNVTKILRAGCNSGPAELGCQMSPRAGVHVVHPSDILLREERVFERLDEVEVLDPTVRAGDSLAVVREEVEPLLRMDDKLPTGCALQTNTVRETFPLELVRDLT